MGISILAILLGAEWDAPAWKACGCEEAVYLGTWGLGVASGEYDLELSRWFAMFQKLLENARMKGIYI